MSPHEENRVSPKQCGAVIRQLRRAQGLTQSQLLARIDEICGSPDRLTVRTLSRIENGGRMYVSTAGEIARALRVSLSEIVDTEVVNTEDLQPPRRGRGSMSLYDCQQDFLQWERTVPSGAALTIRTIAIDLSYAWENVLVTINHALATDLRFEILVLNGETERIPGIVPPAVVAWSKAAAANLAAFKTALAGFSGNKDVHVEVRQYSQVPSIHGVEAEKGSARRWWITECRYTGALIKNYDFGDGHYKTVPGHTCSKSDKELAARFRTELAGLWEGGLTAINQQL